MIRAIAIDDEPPALQVIETFSRKIDFLQLNRTFFKTSDALAYLESFPVDLIFLDIQMPAINGMDFSRNLPEKKMVIFTTAYSEYAVDGFNVSAIDYLLKPFTFQRFAEAVNKAKHFAGLSSNEKLENQYLTVRVDYSLVKVALRKILYVEGLDDYLKIHLADQPPVVVRMTMKHILEQLPRRDFARIHRSYIIPISRVRRVRNKTVFIETIELPIGASFEEKFIRKFSSRLT